MANTTRPLEELSREELVELIRSLIARNATLEAEVARLGLIHHARNDTSKRLHRLRRGKRKGVPPVLGPGRQSGAVIGYCGGRVPEGEKNLARQRSTGHSA